MEINKVDNFTDWDKWKRTIADAVNLGQTVGLSEKTIDGIGYRIGNILAASVDPENREHRLLQELWKVGDENDRRTLAKMIVKMAEADDR